MVNNAKFVNCALHTGETTSVSSLAEITLEFVSPCNNFNGFEVIKRIGHGQSLGIRIYNPNSKKTLTNSTSVPPGNLRRLQDNLHGSSVGHTGYTSSSSTITKRSSALYSIKSAANSKSHNSIARNVFKLLHSHPHIRVSWMKAHSGYIGNEEAYRLEAAGTENFPETPLEFPKSFFKTFLRQKMLATWQMTWDDGDTGRLIQNIIPKVSLQPINWTCTKVLFFTGHGPFPSFRQRFNLAETSFCSCGGIGIPIHYATVCLLITSYRMAPPSQQHHPVWFRSVAKNSTARRKIHNLLHFLQRETSLFRPDPN
ncbi:hypothetical protein AVEN_141523-1 [Araneus ventricosus]|uniref:RNase H type-1 domain-containing protein n=1 Tax=Araneus ventricosus TaxID=182803 RepID=A0A4Y2VDM6_ARAVE|nr:hypothetical protein AVEN_141523-1 [Araneus ventricosus]